MKIASGGFYCVHIILALLTNIKDNKNTTANRSQLTRVFIVTFIGFSTIQLITKN